jgi:hypothetical protein
MRPICVVIGHTFVINNSQKVLRYWKKGAIFSKDELKNVVPVIENAMINKTSWNGRAITEATSTPGKITCCRS